MTCKLTFSKHTVHVYVHVSKTSVRKQVEKLECYWLRLQNLIPLSAKLQRL